MFTVYVIQNEKGKRYTGQTGDIYKRILRHNGMFPSKSRSYTKLNGPKWNIVYTEEYESRKEAIKREKYLKSYRGRQYIKSKLIVLGP